MNDIYDIPPSKGNESSYAIGIYAIVGKSLTLATAFEKNCKALAAGLKLKRNPELFREENSLNKVVEGIDKETLCKTLYGFLGNLEETLCDRKEVALIKEAVVIFEEARKHRNYIAHELAVGLMSRSEGDSILVEFKEDLRRRITELALANLIICTVMSKFSNEPILTPEHGSTYPDKVTRWVLDSFVD